MAADLTFLGERIRSEASYYEDRTASGLDLEAVLGEARAALAGVRAPADFERVLRRVVAAMQDGHAHLRLDVARPARRRLPFTLADCREGLMVARVAPDLAGPQRGDLLVALAGRPVADWLAEYERVTFGSTPGQRRHQAIGDLHWLEAARVACRFAIGEGGERTLELRTLADEPAALRPEPEARQARVTWPRPGVAMLRIPTFAVDRWQEWLKAKPEEREPFLDETKRRFESCLQEVGTGKATTLILDLRGNSGGTDSLGIFLAERLLDGPFHYFLLSAQVDGKWTPPRGYEYGKEKPAHSWRGKLIALVDSGCFSTTDNFLRCLDDLHPDFTVVGRPTAGGTGAPRVIATLPHSKAEITLCTHRVRGPKGELTEGRGTRPDVAVDWTRQDLLDGRDPDLEAALRLVK
jgi:hypothetical protein